MASASHGANSATTERDAGHLMKNNFEYTKHLAEWCGDRKTPVRLIYASSAATYGDGSLGIVAPHLFDLTYELL